MTFKIEISNYTFPFIQRWLHDLVEKSVYASNKKLIVMFSK